MKEPDNRGEWMALTKYRAWSSGSIITQKNSLFLCRNLSTMIRGAREMIRSMTKINFFSFSSSFSNKPWLSFSRIRKLMPAKSKQQLISSSINFRRAYKVPKFNEFAMSNLATFGVLMTIITVNFFNLSIFNVSIESIVIDARARVVCAKIIEKYFAFMRDSKWTVDQINFNFRLALA